MQWPDFQQETTLLCEGFSSIVGVDEVGRGPLAGPVAAAAVILNPNNLPLGVADSKALNAKHRDSAFESIIERAQAISISFVTAAEIDRINIRHASLLAMKRAIDGLSLKPGFALIDGRDRPELDCPARAIIKGDATVLSIAAASIVAKVARDGMMRRLALLYPDYGFETNVGYGAKRHLEALERLGPTPFHRFSFAPLRKRNEAQHQK